MVSYGITLPLCLTHPPKVPFGFFAFPGSMCSCTGRGLLLLSM